MWDLIQGRPFDLQAFAERLERNAQEYVKWEHRKLQWIQEEKQQSSGEQGLRQV